MKKVASFADLKKVRSMSLNQFNKWVTTIYKTGFDDGLDVGIMWDDKTIYKLLRQEKIGEERAMRIVQKLVDGDEVDCDSCKYRKEEMNGAHCKRCTPTSSKYEYEEAQKGE